MKVAKNILVATDFSELGRGVVDHALELAIMLDAQLSVVTVYTPVGAVPLDNPETRSLRAELRELAEKLRPSGRLAHASVEVGEPGETILAVARQRHADLIVVGSNALHGFARFVNGSVSRAVLTGTNLPVLVVTKAAVHARSVANAHPA